MEGVAMSANTTSAECRLRDVLEDIACLTYTYPTGHAHKRHSGWIFANAARLATSRVSVPSSSSPRAANQ